MFGPGDRKIGGKQEERAWRRRERASNERAEVMRRARALLAVAQKQTFARATTTTEVAGANSVCHLVDGSSSRDWPPC